MDERVIRVTTASGIVPNTIDGRINDLIAAKNAPGSSDCQVSININPVFASIQYSEGKRPDAGSPNGVEK